MTYAVYIFNIARKYVSRNTKRQAHVSKDLGSTGCEERVEQRSTSLQSIKRRN